MTVTMSAVQALHNPIEQDAMQYIMVHGGRVPYCDVREFLLNRGYKSTNIRYRLVSLDKFGFIRLGDRRTDIVTAEVEGC